MKPLVRHLLFAVALWLPVVSVAAIDIQGVYNASLDQPQINAAITLPGSTSPLAEPLSGTFNIQAFFDTGASGVLVSKETADAIGLPLLTNVFFGDVGVGGEETFRVSSEVDIYLESFPSLAVDNPATFLAVYDQKFTDIRTQVSIHPSDPLLGPLDVFGMPLFQGKTVVMDARPLNDLSGNMETVVYNSLAHPNVPTVDRTIQMSYGNFLRFTRTYEINGPNEDPLDPATFGPSFSTNPFIGPDPVAMFENGGVAPDGSPPPVVIEHDGNSTTGSFLFDTGAAASILSQVKAAELGITYAADDNNPNTPPQLLLNGVPVEDQFLLSIGGVGGTAQVAGMFFDAMTVPTIEGDPIRYIGAPFLVLDITVQDPITADSITLDGIFGMNYLVASALVDESFPFPLLDFTVGAYDFLVFDEASGTLGLSFDPNIISFLDGDYDNNGLVGQGDLALVLAYWGQAVEDGQSIDPTWTNTIGVTAPLIGQDELALVLQHWGDQAAITSQLTQISATTGLTESQILELVPEPTTLAMISLGTLLLLRRRAA